MKTKTLLLTMLVLGAIAFAAVPAAEARQACVYDGRSDPCDDHLVCVWDRTTSSWLCKGYIGCGWRCW